mmetsp:Transcript_9609/g.23830  ORF Transcript_9609/g.23830 Transcript_9609/m.23830 type:complete len:251 (+) Transcript_9609:1078-1830(+)
MVAPTLAAALARKISSGVSLTGACGCADAATGAATVTTPLPPHLLQDSRLHAPATSDALSAPAAAADADVSSGPSVALRAGAARLAPMHWLQGVGAGAGAEAAASAADAVAARCAFHLRSARRNCSYSMYWMAGLDTSTMEGSRPAQNPPTPDSWWMREMTAPALADARSARPSTTSFCCACMRVATTLAGMVISWLPAPARAATRRDDRTPMSLFLVLPPLLAGAGAAPAPVWRLSRHVTTKWRSFEYR